MRGSYRVVLDSGGRHSLFGCIIVGACTGRILRAYLMRGNGTRERRYDQVADIRQAIKSWVAEQAAPPVHGS